MRIVVIGLGYVGLPLAKALADHFSVVGFDIDSRRISDLRAGIDKTGEVSTESLKASSLQLSSDPSELRGAEIIIVTVPTPVDASNQPDLSPLFSACDLIGEILEQGATIVFESTVYPGVTEEICGPRIAEQSGLTIGVDFFLGSPSGALAERG